MSKSSKPAEVADYGDEAVCFADNLARIEQHGGVTHLRFRHSP